ncbi:MAG: DUF4097 family beta strand repeat-containing protein [Marinoscillum sp.]
MKNLLIVLLLTAGLVTNAQRKVTESATVSGQDLLELGFDFADEIEINTWDKNEVLVEVSVSINDGEYDHIFTLDKRVTERSIRIDMDKDMWKKIDREDSNCSFTSNIYYKVYMPASLELESNTISGDYLIKNYAKQLNLKTISGDIDISVPSNKGLDFKAKTVSGEIYSDLDIEYPDGREGLKQIVGMNVTGRIYNGGTPMKLETISGNIYLRRG